MNSTWAIFMLAGALGTTAFAQQTETDPSVKTSQDKAAKAKKPGKQNCAGMQGGVDASGGENVEAHAKGNKATAANSANCGKHNGKAATPEAAPTTPHPEIKDPVLRKPMPPA
ncbi:hypothetical protein EV582_1680 [Duganella sp. BK701]|uniref:hypothetical protein n=1 Tax=unclassified Duganella TaxID=2636909 RepID=UPI001028CAFA|nr:MULTISPECIES: hypothetical protein [unclassified Duganella]RZT09627.1 hypothetical protein EV582_1680 [Duganella sp. BK701]